MRLSKLLSVFSIGLLAGFTSASFECDKGILNDDICCSAGCGECGGSGCGNRVEGLDKHDCCTRAIRDYGKTCSEEVGPPCAIRDPMTDTGAFTCSDGVRKGDFCCSAGCGECDGSGCGDRGGGLDKHDCCTGAIRDSGKICSEEDGPPCMINASDTGESTCSDGIVGIPTNKGDVCCSVGCGECGGSGCSSRGGLTGDDCCTRKIKDSGKECSETREAPCFFQDTPAPTPAPVLFVTGAGTPMCRNGFFGVQDDDFCCPAVCGYCGGSGCGKRNGEDCCTSASETLCSEAGSAPCVLDPISRTYEEPNCSHTPTIDMSDSEAIYLRSGGCVTLTDIYNKQDSDNGPLWVLDSDDNKVDGGGEPAEPTGYWLLTSSLIVLDNAKLVVKGTDIDGDCDVLRVQSTDDYFWEITGHGGSLHFEGTTVTSWDTDANEQRKYDKEREDEEGFGRSFIRCLTQYDDTEYYSCEGTSTNDKGTCRMDLLNSTFANLGYLAAESYGITWKVRGLCPKLENLKIFEEHQVYGNIKYSDISGMYYGHYSYGHQDGVWIHNKMHDNIQYGFDPHDDSDNLTIAHNEVWGNGNHGIIASKRCNDVKIYNNTVYDGGRVGIFLHRSSDNAEVYDNIIYNNGDAGIAFMESFGGKVYNNSITNCKYGVRLSVGASDNTFMYNNMTDIGLDKDDSGVAIYTYEGSDSPLVSDNGRPRDNTFSRNIVNNSELAIKLKEADDTIFEKNIFINAGKFEFDDSTGTFWAKDNDVGDSCVEEDDRADFAQGSDDITC